MNRSGGASFLEEVDFLADLAPGERERLATSLRCLELQPGEWLFQEGEAGEALALIESGRVVATSRYVPARRERLGAGTAVGALALLGGGPHLVGLVAETPTRVWLLEREAYERLGEQHPHLARKLAEAAAREAAVRARRALLGQVDPTAVRE